MAELAVPFDAQPLNEGDWSKMAREYAGQGVIGTLLDLNLYVYADGSGMNVFVSAGSALVRGHLFTNTTTKTVAIPGNTGAIRFDRIVAQLDPTANTITIIRHPGTSGGGVPALTQTDTGLWQLPLAIVQVGTNVTNIANANVTDNRIFVGLDITPCYTVDQILSPRRGKMAFEFNTGKWKAHNGTEWKVVGVGDISEGTYSANLHDQFGVPSGVQAGGGRYAIHGGMCTGYGASIYIVNGSWAGVGAYIELPLPAGAGLSTIDGFVVGYWSARAGSTKWGVARLVGPGSSLLELRSPTNTQIVGPPEQNIYINAGFNYPV